MKNTLEEHFNKHNLDIRRKDIGYSRFMDQKVTPDVLQFVSECIVQYVQTNHNPFSSSDIEHLDYFRKNVARQFNKPTPEDGRTKREYDKWPAQIIQTLRFAKVLKEVGKNGRATIFEVVEPQILEYVSTQTQHAYTFLVFYITKVLKDSGFYIHFEKYRDKYISGSFNKSDFNNLKETFLKFIHGYTNIKREYEPKRIFPKVLNILASEHRLPGSIHGLMSQFPFVTSDLIYNRTNFRDKDKSKYISRQEQGKLRKTINERKNPTYRITKAKARIKELHSKSEINDQWAIGDATQVHHIFPENEFPRLADRLENLIRLTPTQHNSKAHPQNKTSIIDRDYQLVCLIEKSYSIENSLEKGEYDYSKESFIGVINRGLGLKLPYNASFQTIRNLLQKH